VLPNFIKCTTVWNVKGQCENWTEMDENLRGYLVRFIYCHFYNKKEIENSLLFIQMLAAISFLKM
jgi:hypothetical protein